MPDPVPNPIAAQISTPPPTPSLSQQAAGYTAPDSPAPASATAPINMPQGPAPAVPQQQQPAVKGPSPWQRAVHALLGSQTEYTQTPNGPVPVQVENKPGQLFRSILAGAILGAGAGTANAEHSAGSGWNAAGQGAAAAQRGMQEQEQQKAAQAQKQFENQQSAQRENQEELVRKAQIAEANAQTLRINKEIQGTDYTQHQQIAAAGKASVQPYEDAGISPVASDLTESQMHQYFQDHPGAGTLDWEPVSVKTVMAKDANGNETPSFEMVYSAYDPKGKVTVPDSTVAEWRKNGVFDRYPEYGTVLANNKVIPASTYIQVKRDAEKVMADNLAKQKQAQTDQIDQLKIDETKALIKEHQVETWKAGLEGREKADQEKDKAALETAWQHLADAGNDPNKSPMTAQDRITIGRNAQPLIQDALNAIKTAAADPSQQDQLPALWSNYQSLSRLANIGATGGPANDPIQKTVDTLKGKSPQEIQDALNDPKNGVPDAAKTEIWKRLGITPPQPKPLLVPNAAGRAVGSAAQSAVSAAEQAAPFIP